MKVKQEKPAVFFPITITAETEQEAKWLLNCVHDAYMRAESDSNEEEFLMILENQ